MADSRMIEIRNLKWPRREPRVSMGQFLGEDGFGRWVGLTEGDPWRAADGTPSGAFRSSFVLVVPRAAYWTACFHPRDPVVDVDIVLPANWVDDVLDLVDLELDVLRSADGRVQVRDQNEFERTRATWAMPDDIAARAESTCEQIRDLVERHAEPFGSVGLVWLARFLVDSGAPVT